MAFGTGVWSLLTATPLMRLRISRVARCGSGAGWLTFRGRRTGADGLLRRHKRGRQHHTREASVSVEHASEPSSSALIVPFHATLCRNRNAIICKLMGNRRIRVFAPATVANIGPGFDVLGLALSSPGDLLDAELSDTPGVEIVEMTGDGGRLSRDAMKNVASRAAADVLRRAGSEKGLRLWLHKQMPLASGLGSSGASSAAGAVAANEILGRPLIAARRRVERDGRGVRRIGNAARRQRGAQRDGRIRPRAQLRSLRDR